MKDCDQASLTVDNIKFSVWISFFEIYNECIYDLFVPASPKFQKRKMLRLSQDVKGYSFIKGTLMDIFILLLQSSFLGCVIVTGKQTIMQYHNCHYTQPKKGSMFWYIYLLHLNIKRSSLVLCVLEYD
jgi:hypothetical protein